MTHITAKDGAALGSRRFHFNRADTAIGAWKETDDAADWPFLFTRRKEKRDDVSHLQ